MKTGLFARRPVVKRGLSLLLLLVIGFFAGSQPDRKSEPTPQAALPYVPAFQAGNGMVRNARDPSQSTLLGSHFASTNRFSPSNAGKSGSTVAGPVSGFVLENTWSANPSPRRGCVNDTVYAGALHQAGNLGQGAIVLDFDMYCVNHIPMLYTYLTPIRAGSLRVVDAVGKRLVLRSSAGYGFLFDFSTPGGYSTGQWISFLPPQPGKQSVEKIDPNSKGWLSLGEDKVRQATRGTIVEYGFSDLPPEGGAFQNQWFESQGLSESGDFGYDMHGFGPVIYFIGQAPSAGAFRTRIYAGAERADPSQGLLVVAEYKGDPPEQALHSYGTPERKGSIRIVDVVGQMLVAKAQDGTLFYFDLLWRDWIAGACTPRLATVRPGEKPRYEFLTPAGVAAYNPGLRTWAVDDGTTKIEVKVGNSGAPSGPVLEVGPTGVPPTDQSQVYEPQPALLPLGGQEAGVSPTEQPQVYEPPQPTAGLTIIDTVCQRLTIENGRGELLYFDVASRRWVQP